jgi:hypothetical protein
VLKIGLKKNDLSDVLGILVEFIRIVKVTFSRSVSVKFNGPRVVLLMLNFEDSAAVAESKGNALLISIRAQVRSSSMLLRM